MLFPLHPDAQARLAMLPNVAEPEADDVSSDPDPSGCREELASPASSGTSAAPGNPR